MTIISTIKNYLPKALKRYGGELHAYCLMTNHVHLLISPVAEDSIPRIVQHLGRQYVQYINKYYRRSGTLWEGRYKSSLIDEEHYLLTCSRYIELNPVAAGMVKTPDEYRWSSYVANAWGRNDALVIPHEVYLRTGSSPEERICFYRELFKHAIPDEDIHNLKESVNRNDPTGHDRFKRQIESALGRKLGSGVRGRPRTG